jgi:hypothetical protein
MTVAKTINVATTEAVYTGTSENDGLVAITNVGSNNVWISLKPDSVAAAAEGDDCEVILPNQTIYMDWDTAYRMIAVTTATKVNIANSMGRTRK